MYMLRRMKQILCLTNSPILWAVEARTALLQGVRRYSKRTEMTIFSGKTQDPKSRGLVLGVYANPHDKLDPGCLTDVGDRYNRLCTNGRLLHLLQMAGPMPKVGECRIFYHLDQNFSAVAVCGLGRRCQGYDCNEVIDEQKEAVRRASATGCKELQKLDTQKIFVESFDACAESAAEGAGMAVWNYQELKEKKNQRHMPLIDLHVEPGIECDWASWRIGMAKATAQNLARQLQDTPANILTPTNFAQNVVRVLCKSGINVEVKVKSWIERQNMNALLAVSRASCEDPAFLELSYYGTDRDELPIVLIGQGLTFDCGGLQLQDCEKLQDMRGSVSGAACVVAACNAVASLEVPINIRALIPLCESVIGSQATRPGDVVKSMCGKSIEIQSTEHMRALMLTDALQYAQNFHPKFVIDVGSTTRDGQEALGEAAAGVFTNSLKLWEQFRDASIHTGDRVWRLPLWNYYSRQISSSKTVDLQNLGEGKGGYICRSAAFLKEFLQCGQWMHVETGNVVTTDGSVAEYLDRGMSGRPTRTLVEFLASLSSNVKKS